MSAPESPTAAGEPRTSAVVEVGRWRDGRVTRIADQVAEEAPVALKYQGIPHVVMLASPADLLDLAVGFTLSEAVVAHVDEIRSVELGEGDGGPEINVDLAPGRLAGLLKRQRNLFARTGCGLCGAETIDAAIRQPPPVAQGTGIATALLDAALRRLPGQQLLNQRVGSLHAAAWLGPDGGIGCVREDVGRHNALDKLIGARLRAGASLADGVAVVTSRASYEMVQKATTVGITMLVAVSAPTALAVRLAERCGLTLVGFARPGQHVVYSHPERLGR